MCSAKDARGKIRHVVSFGPPQQHWRTGQGGCDGVVHGKDAGVNIGRGAFAKYFTRRRTC